MNKLNKRFLFAGLSDEKSAYYTSATHSPGTQTFYLTDLGGPEPFDGYREKNAIPHEGQGDGNDTIYSF